MSKTMVVALGMAFLVAGGLIMMEPWNPRLDEQVTVSGDASHERSFYLEEGQALEWRWRSDQHVRFDVHSHEEENVVEHVVVEGKRDHGSFLAPAEGVYSVFWNVTGLESGVAVVEYTIDTDGWDLDSTSH